MSFLTLLGYNDSDNRIYSIVPVETAVLSGVTLQTQVLYTAITGALIDKLERLKTGILAPVGFLTNLPTTTLQYAVSSVIPVYTILRMLKFVSITVKSAIRWPIRKLDTVKTAIPGLMVTLFSPVLSGTQVIYNTFINISIVSTINGYAGNFIHLLTKTNSYVYSLFPITTDELRLIHAMLPILTDTRYFVMKQLKLASLTAPTPVVFTEPVLTEISTGVICLTPIRSMIKSNAITYVIVEDDSE